MRALFKYAKSLISKSALKLFPLITSQGVTKKLRSSNQPLASSKSDDLIQTAQSVQSVSELELDQSWYSARYPDVVAAGMDPGEHFVRYGHVEGRYPNQSAETRAIIDIQSHGAEVQTISYQGIHSGREYLANKNFLSALSSFERLCDGDIINRDENYRADGYYGLGLSLLMLGRFGEAKDAFFQSFEKSNPSFESGMRYGELTLFDENYRDGLRIFERVLVLAPDNAETLLYIGICHLNIGNRSLAIEFINKSIQVYPDFPLGIVAKFFVEFLAEFKKPTLPHNSRKPILILLSPFMKYWLGGQNYIQNVIKTLNHLPQDRRPRLNLIVLIDDWEEVESIRDVILKSKEDENIYAIFDRHLNVIHVSNHCARYERIHMKKYDDPTAWKMKLLEESVASFPFLYPLWPLRNIGRPIYWIPDLQHKFLPENFDLDELRARNIAMNMLSNREVKVIFSSYDARRHYEKYFQNYKSKNFVWHFFNTLLPSDLDKCNPCVNVLNLPERFYYVANQFWRHKNHVLVFQSLSILVRNGRKIYFVFTGTDLKASQDPYHMELLKLIEVLGIEDYISVLGVLPRAMQLNVLRRAYAVIQPSRFEGWSTVVEDARSFGIPIIASSIDVNVEQIGEDGLFFDPEDALGLSKIIEKVELEGRYDFSSKRENEAEARCRGLIQDSANKFMHILLSD